MVKKICFVGTENCGKTTLVNKLLDNDININNNSKYLHLQIHNGIYNEYHYQILDISGTLRVQEYYKYYCNQANYIFLCYDLMEKDIDKKLLRIIECMERISNFTKIILIQCKNDIYIESKMCDDKNKLILEKMARFDFVEKNIIKVGNNETSFVLREKIFGYIFKKNDYLLNISQEKNCCKIL